MLKFAIVLLGALLIMAALARARLSHRAHPNDPGRCNAKIAGDRSDHLFIPF